MSTVDVRLAISLEVDNHPWQNCTDLAEPLRRQLAEGRYDLMSVMPCPLTIDQWRDEHRTARKRADRAERRGYRAHELERDAWELDIHHINISSENRQGRRMAPGYWTAPQFAPLPDYPCPRHAVRTTGVWSDTGYLVAYLTMIRAGELALVSQILGHADHLENEIMYLLFEHALEREIAADPECLVVYNRHDSGTDGLRFFKERLGFQEMPVEWLP